MATVTLKGNEIHTLGNLPEKGSQAPDFTLVTNDLSTVSLADYKGHKLVLNIFPSIDTGTCAQSVRQFNEEAAELENTIVLCISKDLPFAQARFCGAEGIENVETLSDYRDGNFGKSYKVEFTDGPLKGLLSRSVVVIDEQGTVLYTEQVSETVDEPNYKAALEALMDA
ncbi:MAG: lipid hydroperoxide peroxidase [Muricauda sp.]|nr:thiol peroxidase [Allomuricauda sp.]MBC29468.1 lipid hydroperoxide peroxidase [Allomuricauda sp.]|tara:strand:+ start:630 stop:1136 length:507 start_codon:yes stop_codon:yes gene_type:complete